VLGQSALGLLDVGMWGTPTLGGELLPTLGARLFPTCPVRYRQRRDPEIEECWELIRTHSLLLLLLLLLRDSHYRS